RPTRYDPATAQVARPGYRYSRALAELLRAPLLFRKFSGLRQDQQLALADGGEVAGVLAHRARDRSGGEGPERRRKVAGKHAQDDQLVTAGVDEGGEQLLGRGADERTAAHEQPGIGAEALLGPDRAAQHARPGDSAAASAHDDGAAAHAVAEAVAGLTFDDQ